MEKNAGLFLRCDLFESVQLLAFAMIIRKSKNQEEIKFRAYWNLALAYLCANGYPLWPEYPEKMIKDEIQNSLHFSAFMSDGRLVGYFSLALSDPIFWAAADKKYIRMDTWGENTSLVDYYTSCGFKLLKKRVLGEIPSLPSHYNNIELAIFQNKV